MLIGSYLQPGEIAQVEESYVFSAAAHTGQRRQSGEPYIHHPLEVARLLAGMRMDHQTLMAAILHDVIEDTPTAKEEIRKRFGAQVAELVDGVSNLAQVSFLSQSEKQSENFRKMIMAMSHDIRVILVKLADRLHNMRTLSALDGARKKRIARETLDVYAPIALRLGMNSIRLELEELSFRHLYPLRYRVLEKRVEQARGHRKEVISRIRNTLQQRMKQEKIPGEVFGREKHLYGIYRKMCQQRLSFAEIHDVYAFRVITDEVDTCYRLLGAIHNLYKPVPGKFKDYIAIPKNNGYQSLHTVLFGPHGLPMEVQIRSRAMDDVAEVGIAAHWLYKTSGADQGSVIHARAHEWIRNIVDMHRTSGNSEEFLENVKIDLFPDSIYVFTPGGEILELPRSATAVDFAYAIHTDVGNHCVSALIDRKQRDLATRLLSGQQVEVITSPDAQPKPAWLNFVVTAKARSSIRHYLKNMQISQAITLGRKLLNHELRHQYHTRLQDLSATDLEQWLSQNDIPDQDTLLKDIGLGNRLAPFVARSLLGVTESDGRSTVQNNGNETQSPLLIRGTEGIVVNFPRCCYPIPGDPIYGVLTTGRGLVIHTRSCRNLQEWKHHPEKWLHVQWERNIAREFPVRIGMTAVNQRGVLATVAAAFADAGANISNVEINERDGQHLGLLFTIDVRDHGHLQNVLHRVGRVKSISEPERC